MDLNKVMLIGRVTKDPEVRTIQSGQMVASFSMATNRQWKDAQGNRQEKGEFHNIVAWRKLAEIIQTYVKKGMKIYIEGRLETRSWDDPQGVKKYRTEIVLDNMIMLDGKNSSTPTTRTTPTSPSSPSSPASPASPSSPAPVAGDVPAPTVNNSDEEIRIEDIPF
ncbi:MAG: single-stranded DNA-binding protein [Patescibacteria group bacterium]|jgi:single-strand DNA-binding protein